MEYLQTFCFEGLMQKEDRIQPRKKIKRVNCSSLGRDIDLYVTTQGSERCQNRYIAANNSMSRHRKHEKDRNSVAIENLSVAT